MKSLYDYTNLINNLVDENDRINEQIQKLFNQIHSPTASTTTFRTGSTAILRSDKLNKTAMGYDIIKSKTLPVNDKPLKIVELNPEQFSELTHTLIVSIKSKDFYTEVTETRVVGKVTVEWWEYVLLYGIFKYIQIELSLSKHKELIRVPKIEKQSIQKSIFQIYFKPKKNYQQEIHYIEIPYKSVSITKEIIRENIIFQIKIDTFEIDSGLLGDSLEEQINKLQYSEFFKTDIIKKIYGRLRTL